MKRKPDPLLRLQPWKVTMVFDPIERILHRIEADGVVDSIQGRPVFHEDGRGGWHEVCEAMRGIIQFHQLAESRHGLPVDVQALIRFANKLDAGAPVFDSDIRAVRACIANCKAQAMRMRVSQATDIVNTIRIGAEFDRIKAAA